MGRHLLANSWFLCRFSTTSGVSHIRNTGACLLCFYYFLFKTEKAIESKLTFAIRPWLQYVKKIQLRIKITSKIILQHSGRGEQKINQVTQQTAQGWQHERKHHLKENTINNRVTAWVPFSLTIMLNKTHVIKEYSHNCIAQMQNVPFYIAVNRWTCRKAH